MTPIDIIRHKINLRDGNYHMDWQSVIPKQHGHVWGDMRRDLVCSSKDLLTIEPRSYINARPRGFWWTKMLRYRSRKVYDIKKIQELVEWEVDGWKVEAHTLNGWHYVISWKKVKNYDLWVISIATVLTWR